MARRQKARGTVENAEDELLKAFARKVREARKRTGLTRAQLGDLTGLAPSYLHEIENEGANVTLKTLAKLAESLKLGPRDLLPESEQDALTDSAVAELIAALDRAADVLSQRHSQESELISRLDRLTQLRAALERLAVETKKGARRRVLQSLWRHKARSGGPQKAAGSGCRTPRRAWNASRPISRIIGNGFDNRIPHQRRARDHEVRARGRGGHGCREDH
jgi:transcriptional regulator with XRE-family HTH domain